MYVREFESVAGILSFGQFDARAFWRAGGPMLRCFGTFMLNNVGVTAFYVFCYIVSLFLRCDVSLLFLDALTLFSVFTSVNVSLFYNKFR